MITSIIAQYILVVSPVTTKKTKRCSHLSVQMVLLLPCLGMSLRDKQKFHMAVHLYIYLLSSLIKLQIQTYKDPHDYVYLDD